MTNHACAEMYALMKRLADTYQHALEANAESADASQAEHQSSSLFDVRREMRDHQVTCMHCRHTMQRISMHTSGRARVA